MAEKIRFIRENSAADGGLAGVGSALANLEGELMDMACALSGGPAKDDPMRDHGENGGRPSRSLGAQDKSARTRNLVRFILHSFSLQVQAGQRASTYSRQDCLDDVESLLETLLEWLSSEFDAG